MKKRVILSVEALSPQLTGVGRYVWELAQRLPVEPGIASVRYVRNDHWIADPAKLLIDGPRRNKSPYELWMRKVSKTSRRLRDRTIAHFSVCHGPNFFLPEFAEQGIITIHDLSVFRYPETHPAERRAQFDQEFAATLGRTAHIITVSETVRQEVIAFTGFGPDKVTAIHQGVGPNFHPCASEDLVPVLARMSLTPGGYALCVSTIEPRKRIGELLKAWRLLPLALRNRCPLVLAGSSGWLSDAILRDMADAEREGWLRYIRYVEEAALPALYAGARLFVYPSVYEGFGLPPIEAMASGVPTIVADISCLPEVTAGAAMLTDPDDVDRFARDLERGLLDEDWRQSAAEAGLAVAAGYSWARCVQETAQLYGRL
ncbi:glycosyltransferase family 4 protein [Sphingobium sp. YR768]|uniref:glycosyltransferase family 4 protein n=1 Tax=Sphingobium sp. YR768 TaxID=1884365 RepID=UPI0008BDF4B7|nr:glycosyltransferase family 1 protein [Sphingobium sp. YR768]SER92110.1 alpha-1,3-rhamnosyl/mannosyltransferase [Sphingobium sp. YR768]